MFIALYCMAGFFAIYGLYTSNMGEISREYLSQVLTVILVAFLVWRAETLQELSDGGPPG